VHQAVDEQQRVAGLQIDWNGALQMVHAIPARIVAGLGMGEVGLVAAGNDHGRPIARPHVGQRQDEVDLPAAEHAVVVVVCPAQRALVAARMHRVVPARPADGSDALVDEQARDVRFLLAAVMAQVMDPARVIEQPLERRAGLDAVVQLEAGLAGVVAALGVAPPLADLERREGVEGRVQLGHQLRLGGPLQDQVAA